MKMNLANGLLLLLLVWNTRSVNGRHPNCHFLYELQMARQECLLMLVNEPPLKTEGCRGTWDNISCWHSAEVGEVVDNSCPTALKNLFTRDGIIRRNCTSKGWSDVYPSIPSVCESKTNSDKLVFYMVVKTLYTLGHSLSLIALITGSAILCLFRKLHCTRNYIHLNLFFSFILRAVAVLVKDAILFYPENVECTKQPSLIGCKASLIILNYFIMANFYWLLVEGLYLHTLLMVIFSENRHFIIYLLIGWGFPTVFVISWIICRIYFEDTGCWERNDVPLPWRVINWPIMASVILNFILFISIIRILVQKLRCPDVGGNDQSQYRRLAKSTLLLIPLFGVNYVVFVYFIHENGEMENYKIFFDLGLGSFQGLVVAILYCFLNSEVQSELKRKWRSLRLKRYIGRDYHLHNSSISKNGADNMVQFHRNSRAQSFLQTETTVV
ncbi:vasoactive intestinal polypeptide receptor 2 [Misgurnus anguillicaudatus]|uniref:vasoactive intestinal polypeptide receptor 2 n=1 Tax=Misgurnus anguillicaudatus TaxID=75329 RepID=UPI00243529A1|nr:vasoactive intestinal polypeptide receptor 2 [Misgurnus anguillicaudatus]